MPTEEFYIVAVEETGNWDAALLAENNLEAAFGIYAVRKGEATYCCEVTPSSYHYFLRNEFVYDTDDDKAHEAAGDLAYEGASEGDCYRDFMRGDPDPRFFETLTVDMDGDPEDEDSDYERELYERVNEYESSDPSFMDILNRETYQAWQVEKRDRRRAMNLSPIANFGINGLDNLPLFVAAANALLDRHKPRLDRLRESAGECAAYQVSKLHLYRSGLAWPLPDPSYFK